MPAWSRDVQYGAAAGFVIIVGIVAVQFGFSAKLVLALLAGVGVLFCASLFEGLPRAAMIGASGVLLLLVAYDLATSCDRACQQTRADAAQQRAAQEQARLAAEQTRLAALKQSPVNPRCNWNTYLINVSPDRLTPLDPENPNVRPSVQTGYRVHPTPSPNALLLCTARWRGQGARHQVLRS